MVRVWGGVAAVCAVLLTSGTASAVPDLFGNGDGHDGALNVTAGSTVTVNTVHSAVTAQPASDALTVADITGFASGDLVLIWQMNGLAEGDAPSGDQTPTHLTGSVGAWELARIVTITAGGGSTGDLTMTGDIDGTFAIGNGGLHQLASSGNDANSVRKLQRTGRHQGSVFAQTMAGEQGRSFTVQVPPDPPDGEIGSQHGRLGDRGLVQSLLGSVLDE